MKLHVAKRAWTLLNDWRMDHTKKEQFSQGQEQNCVSCLIKRNLMGHLLWCIETRRLERTFTWKGVFPIRRNENKRSLRLQEHSLHSYIRTWSRGVRQMLLVSCPNPLGISIPISIHTTCYLLQASVTFQPWAFSGHRSMPGLSGAQAIIQEHLLH